MIEAARARPLGVPTKKPGPDKDPSLTRTLGMLFVTRRCNIDCSYCHMAHDGIEDTPLPTLKRGIDLLLGCSNGTLFHWFGGEPLLRMDLVKAGVAHIEATKPDEHRVEHLITTNGILLHKHLDWLREHGFRFMLSVDGSFESQHTFRKSLGDERAIYERIFATMELLGREGVGYFCNMVVSPESVDRAFDNVAYLKSRGVPRVQLAYELGANWEHDTRASYIRGLEAAIRTFHGKDGFQIQNSPYSEPVLGNPFFVIDCNGDMFQGCAVVLEKTLPTFNDVARLGHISAVDTLVGRQRERLAQVTYFLKHTRPNAADYVRLRSNMQLGYQVRRSLLALGHNV
ncbi:MAG: radical SAM protein [Myxococcales bacterium]|nr:radical SAM protein [Myxococcales bacterium]